MNILSRTDDENSPSNARSIPSVPIIVPRRRSAFTVQLKPTRYSRNSGALDSIILLSLLLLLEITRVPIFRLQKVLEECLSARSDRVTFSAKNGAKTTRPVEPRVTKLIRRSRRVDLGGWRTTVTNTSGRETENVYYIRISCAVILGAKCDRFVDELFTADAPLRYTHGVHNTTYVRWDFGQSWRWAARAAIFFSGDSVLGNN